jgi:hypothetical protein
MIHGMNKGEGQGCENGEGWKKEANIVKGARVCSFFNICLR